MHKLFMVRALCFCAALLSLNGCSQPNSPDIPAAPNNPAVLENPTHGDSSKYLPAEDQSEGDNSAPEKNTGEESSGDTTPQDGSSGNGFPGEESPGNNTPGDGSSGDTTLPVDTSPENPAEGSGTGSVGPEPGTAPDPVVAPELTGASGLVAYLGELPENTETTPYHIRLTGIDLADSGKTGNTLRSLYDALSRYAILDLSTCTGESIPNITAKTAPNKANTVGLILPAGVTTIGINAFSDCSALVSVAMPGVTEIKHGAFSGCAKLTSVHMDEVRIIENDGSSTYGAFYNCDSLKSVSLPGVVKIGSRTFKNCDSLTAVTLGELPPELGADVFAGTKLEKIYVPSKVVDTYKNTTQEGWTDALKLIVTAIPEKG